MKIKRATLNDFDEIVKLIDDHFTAEGFGFVNREQIKTEIKKRRVLVAVEWRKIVGCRIGIDTLWNLVVCPPHRGQGVGRSLVEHHLPRTIRVKADPVGHLSKKQKDNFTDPSGFYEKLGYRYWGNVCPRNFWSGQTGDNERIYYTKGEIPHIKIYKLEGSTLF